MQVSGEELEPATRALAELLLERVDLATGTTRLVIDGQDGSVQWLTRQERIKGTALGRFDRAE